MTASPIETLRAEKAAYAKRATEQGEDRPLGGYLGVMGVYAGVVATAAAVTALRGKRLPERVAPWDLAVVAVATHKLSRLLTKDAITSPLRAPFTAYKEPAGAGEVNEEVRGEGIRHAVGELVTCPFCLGMWVSTAFTGGLVVAPRATRLAASTLAALAVSDFLHFAYVKVEHATEG